MEILLPGKLKKIPLRQIYHRPIFGLIFLVMLSFTLFSTHFTFCTISDREKSPTNTFDAGNLDITLDDPVNFSPDIAPTVDSEADFEIHKNTSVAFQYIIAFKNFHGDLCGHLDLKAFQGDEIAPSYDDALDITEIMASDTDPLDWKFETSLDSSDPAFEDKECDFDIEVTAWQKNSDIYTEGFSDIQTVSAKITSGSWSSGLSAPAPSLETTTLDALLPSGEPVDATDELVAPKNEPDPASEIIPDPNPDIIE